MSHMIASPALPIKELLEGLADGQPWLVRGTGPLWHHFLNTFVT